MRETIFQTDWWLNHAAKDRWQEIVCERGGRLAGVLRYAVYRKGMFNICRNPPMTRLMAPVIFADAKKAESRQRAQLGIIGDLLKQMPACDHIRFTLDPDSPDALAFQLHGYRASVQHTFRLDCRKDPKELWGGMRDKTRNIIRRAQERLRVIEIDDPEVFSAFYQRNLLGRPSYFDLSVIAQLAQACRLRDSGRLVGAVDEAGELQAAVFLVWDTACYYLLSTRRPEIVDNGAVSLLVWHGLQLAQERNLIFDFDGVTGDSQLQFIIAFGGEVASRLVVEKGRPFYDAQRFLREYPRRLFGQAPSTFY
ncbi:MAG TPA: GNAT family N-acetyltransferase [Patescibacteria group bacterium]|nr:GNAT family N-acetyltransferase [Patescibacteria group bacterium]